MIVAVECRLQKKKNTPTDEAQLLEENLEEISETAKAIAKNPRWKPVEKEAQILEFFYDTLEGMQQQQHKAGQKTNFP